jgi:hypothetical protein
MQRKNPGKAMRYLVAVCALISALAMVGCGGSDDEGGTTVTSGETIPSVNTGSVNVSSSNVQALVNQPFAFQPGSIFDPSLGNNPATLTFTSANPSNDPPFSLTSGGATSSGDALLGSCTLHFQQGPLAPKTVKFDPCTFQITSGAVSAGGGAVNGTLTLTLSGPNGSGTSAVITVQITILNNGTLVINGQSTGIIISSNGSPVTTGATGTGGQ